MAETDIVFEQETLGVGTAVRERARHTHQQVAVDRTIGIGVIEDSQRFRTLWYRRSDYRLGQGSPSLRLRIAPSDAHVTP